MPDGDICPITPPGCQLHVDNSEVMSVREGPAGIPGYSQRVLLS